MKLNFVLINYNNSKITIQAIESIINIDKLLSLEIVIFDNNSNDEEKDIIKTYSEKHKYNFLNIIFSEENIGYFSGLNMGISFLLEKYNNKPGYTFIGNNDLIFPKNTLINIQSIKNELDEYPVISPDLITLDGVHQNPHVLYKISNIRKYIYKIYFSNYYFSIVISKIGKLFFKRKDNNNYLKKTTIKQGYGACYILTDLFFDKFKYLDTPVFLMGEEYFLSNQIYSNGMKILYHPKIKVLHYDHASIGHPSSKKMWKITKQSYKLYKNLM